MEVIPPWINVFICFILLNYPVKIKQNKIKSKRYLPSFFYLNYLGVERKTAVNYCNKYEYYEFY